MIADARVHPARIAYKPKICLPAVQLLCLGGAGSVPGCLSFRLQLGTVCFVRSSASPSYQPRVLVEESARTTATEPARLRARRQGGLADLSTIARSALCLDNIETIRISSPKNIHLIIYQCILKQDVFSFQNLVFNTGNRV